MNVRYWPKRNIKRGMAMYVGIFIGDYVKSTTFKKHNSGPSMNLMELLRAKGTRLCGFLKSSVMRRLNLDNEILLLLKKIRKKLRS